MPVSDGLHHGTSPPGFPLGTASGLAVTYWTPRESTALRGRVWFFRSAVVHMARFAMVADRWSVSRHSSGLTRLLCPGGAPSVPLLGVQPVALSATGKRILLIPNSLFRECESCHTWHMTHAAFHATTPPLASLGRDTTHQPGLEKPLRHKGFSIPRLSSPPGQVICRRDFPSAARVFRPSRASPEIGPGRPSCHLILPRACQMLDV